MKVAPNLNFTTIQPTQKSLDSFVQMLKNVYQNLVGVVNGQIGFGDGTNLDNINGSWINVVTPVAPNTDFTVNHNLQRIPSGYWIMQKDRAVDVYTGGVPSTSTQLTLRATVASAVIRLFIIGLLLCFVSRSEAQNVPMHDIALSSANTSVGIVARPISSALVTVCSGSHAEIPCSPAAIIFSKADGTAQANPFNADFDGNFSFFATPGNQYTVSITGVGVTGFNYPYFAPLVTFGALGNATFTSLTSAISNPSSTGAIRLANADNFCWRNFANSSDNCLFPSGGAVANLPANLLSMSFAGVLAPFGVFSSSPTNAATSGAVRFSLADGIAWRNQANSADILLQRQNAIENIPTDVIGITSTPTGFFAPFFVANGAFDNNVSVTGQFRLPSAGTLGWRNAANTQDISFVKTGAAAGGFPADILASSNSPGILAPSFFSASANPPSTGVFRLASSDQVVWRNNANSGDVPLSKNASDQLVYNGNKVAIQSGGISVGHLATWLSDGVIQDGGVVPTNAPVFVVNLTGQVANITPTLITTPGANGFFRFSCYTVVTTAAITSSTLPDCRVNFTDADSSIAETILATNTNTANTVGSLGATTGAGVNANAGFFAKSGVAINISTTGYSSTGSTMQYAIHARLEGPF